MTTPAGIGPKSAYLDWRLWVPYVIMAGMGIPWYWPGEPEALTLVWGLPLWVWTSLGAAFLASFYTAWLLLRYWPLEAEQAEEAEESGDGMI